MASRAVVLSLAALVCFVALALAQPLDEDMQVLLRERRAAARRGGVVGRRGGMMFVGAQSKNAPAYASPEEEEDAAAEEEQPVRRGGRGRPQKPQQEEEEDGGDAGAPPNYSNLKRNGATAIATSYSRGNGASSNSHAVAYDGQFSGGQFRHRYNK